MAEIKVVKLGDVSYELNGKYIQDTAGNPKSWSDIVALANSSKLELKVVESLPTASADTMSYIYLVAEAGVTSGTYVEYVTLRSGTSEPYSYAWERIGTTAADIAGKANKGTYTSSSDGAHTHTVSGSVTVPTVSKTSKHLTASASGTTVAGDGTAAAITALGTATKKDVLGSATTFEVTGGDAVTTNIKATASGTAVGANGTAAAITALGTPTTANAITGFGAHTTADVVTGYSAPNTDEVLGSGTTFSVSGGTATTTNIKATASGTALSTNNADFVKSYPGATSKMVTTSITPTNGTVTASKVGVTAGTAASWSASVTNGVLSFSFTANKPTAVTASDVAAAKVGTAVTVATGSLAADATGGTVMTGLGTATTGKALTSASVSTQPTIALATGATAGAGVISVATGVSAISVSANADDKVNAITSLGTADTTKAITALGTPTTAAAITGFGAHTTKTVLTGVKVTAQPTIALATGATAGAGVISVATGVNGITVAANADDTVSAITGFGAHTTKNVLTGVKVTAQPTITLADTASTGGVEFVSAVTVGSESKSLSNGTAASNGAHTHTTTI